MAAQACLPGAPAAADAEWEAPCCAQLPPAALSPPNTTAACTPLRALPRLLFSLSPEAAPQALGSGWPSFRGPEDQVPLNMQRGQIPGYVGDGLSPFQPSHPSESHRWQTGSLASFMGRWNVGSVSPGYTKLQWPASSCSPASLLSHTEDLIRAVYCHSVWRSHTGHSCSRVSLFSPTQ